MADGSERLQDAFRRVTDDTLALTESMTSWLTGLAGTTVQDLAANLTDPVGRATRVRELLDSALEEIRGDFEAMPDASFTIDSAPLERAYRSRAAGTADAQDLVLIERFEKALAVKAKHGSEYYVGPGDVKVGPTRKELVHRTDDGITLHRFDPGPDAPPRTGEPVLIVYSVINRSYILDLTEDCSVVRHLLGRGLDVYLVEWRRAVAGDHETTLDGFVGPGIHACVDAIRERTGHEQVALFGHCIGGTFAVMYAAKHPERVARLLVLTAPFTAPRRGLVAAMTDRELLPVDALMDGLGMMPAKLIRHTFMGVKPYYEILKWKMFVENLGDDAMMARFAAIDTWANDNVDVPAEVFRGFIRAVFHDDAFLAGTLELGGEPLDLAAIDCPVLNMAGSADWIVPPDSAKALGAVVGGDYRYEEIPGGHLSLILDPRCRARWDDVADFLAGA